MSNPDKIRSIPEILTEIRKETGIEISFKELANVILNTESRIQTLEERCRFLESKAHSHE